MDISEPWMLTEFNTVLPLKAFVSMAYTLLPIVSVFSEVLPENVAYDDEWFKFLPM
jgi:hypothetical protein